MGWEGGGIILFVSLWFQRIKRNCITIFSIFTFYETLKMNKIIIRICSLLIYNLKYFKRKKSLCIIKYIFNGFLCCFWLNFVINLIMISTICLWGIYFHLDSSIKLNNIIISFSITFQQRNYARNYIEY